MTLPRRGFLTGAITGAAWLVTPLLRPARAAALFADGFGRKGTSGGWGKPWFNQRRGTRWGIANGKAFYDLPAPHVGAGRHNPNPVIVLDRDVADVDATTKLSTSNPNARFGLLGRYVGYGEYYGAYLEGSRFYLSSFGMARETVLKSATFSVASNTTYALRLQVTGTEPVVVKAKVWKASRPEPRGWTLAASQQRTDHPIIRRGAFGLLFMHDDITKRKARIRVASFKASSTRRPWKTTPQITFAYVGRIKSEGGGIKARAVVKTDIPANVVIRYGIDARLNGAASVRPDERFSKVWVAKAWLNDLPRAATIYWQATVTSRTGRSYKSRIRSFQTPPPAGSEVRFCFGSCSKSFATSTAFAEAAKLRPQLFVHLGDLGYAESAASGGGAMALTTGSFQDRWTRMLGRRAMTQLHRTSTWLMLQDDHDYGRDDAWSETVRPFTIRAWDEVSGNLRERWFDVRYGDVHFFAVDARVRADDPAAPDSPDHSLLGDVQKAWLKDAMRASDASLLVLFSSQPFWGGGKGLFSWKRAFASERRELLEFFGSLQGADRRVVICSGNSHAHYVNRFDVGTGKEIVEFVSSGMDRREPQAGPPLPDDGIIDPQRAKKSVDAFGYVRLKPAGNNPRVEIRCLDSDTGRDVWPALSLDL